MFKVKYKKSNVVAKQHHYFPVGSVAKSQKSKNMKEQFTIRYNIKSRGYGHFLFFFIFSFSSRGNMKGKNMLLNYTTQTRNTNQVAM